MALNIVLSGNHYPIMFGLETMVKTIMGVEHHIEKVDEIFQVETILNNKKIDILISDITLNGKDCITLLSKLVNSWPDLKSLIVSNQPSLLFATRFLEAGAYGYLSTSDPEEAYKSALKRIYKGKLFIPQEVKEILNLTTYERTLRNPFNKLSNQELCVLLNIMQGKNTKQIAAQMDLKQPTVSTYRLRIFKKIGVKGLFELISIAKRYNIHPIQKI